MAGMSDPMSTRQLVGMQLIRRSERAEAARADLASVLPGADVTEPDADGTFEIAVEAPSREAALKAVWDAVAASGADEHIVFAEHPDVPEHWRVRGDAAS
jgi:hypothetical protein